ncbi:MAG: lysophospholipid acyltransferase family protein [Candidatus Marinimicrobia bacterium]|nr:lysophospholipid acyltransferase family protein [Candidatus Neomarinimicrobiota bacterium]
MSDSVSIQIKTILGSLLLKFIYGSNRKDVKGRENYESLIKEGKSVILSVWHGQLLSIVRDLRKENFYAIAGTHEDAEIISRIATKWGWNMMRGSSKEKGEVAYKNMINALKQPGNAVFITPDGPTGPARIPKPGGIRAAQATNAAIIPISVHSTRRWGFTNWDTFYLEKPFGKIYIQYGEPIFFEKKQDFDECSQILIEKMNELENINL